MTLSVGIALAADLVRAVTLGAAEDRVAVAPAVRVPPAGRPVVGDATRYAGGALYRDYGDRVGDPVPVVGSDGTARLGADLVALTVAGLLAHAAQGTSPAHLAIAHPAHWGRYELSVLHSALTTTTAGDVPISLVSAPLAAVAAAEAAGAVQRGEAVLVADIGGAGTELSLLSAGADRARQVVTTARVEELGATALDRALARHVLAQLGDRFGTFDPADPANHAALHDLVARCRVARAELGVRPATVVDVGLPAGLERVRVIRTEFEALTAEPISAVVSAIARMVAESETNGVTVSEVLLTGEPARTPLLTEQLSVRIRARVLVPPDAEWTVAAGAAAMAAARAHRPQPPLPRPRAAAPAPYADPRITTSEAALPPVHPRHTPPVRAEEPPTPAPTPQAPTLKAPTARTTPEPRPAPHPTADRGAAKFRTAVVTVIAGFAVLLAGGVAVSSTGGGGGSHLASSLHSHR
ncbi:MAG TPA: Hsp70 family protein [Pseudonocardia sp.]|nr:Hsp70 family protein [Pseudonocardia sp.]